MDYKKLAGLFIVTAFLLGVSALAIPVVSADSAGGEADVGNTTPEVIGTAVDTDPVDPESYFWINTEVRDNNSLSDVDNVIVTVWEDSGAIGDLDHIDNHYTFWFDPSDNSWHSPSSNTLGDDFIDSGSSTYPADLSANSDNYNFKVLLNGTASPTNWDYDVEVDDGTATDNLTTATAFSVNNYVSYSLGVASINWTGLSPGSSDNPSDDNPVSANSIETNVSYDVQTDLTGDWSNGGGTTIGMDNTKFNDTNDSGTASTMSDTMQDVYTGESYGEDISKDIYYWLDIPSGTAEGTYTTTFEIEVVEN